MKDYEIVQLQHDIGVAKGTNVPESFSDALLEALKGDDSEYIGMRHLPGQRPLFFINSIERKVITMTPAGHFYLDSNLAIILDEGTA